MRQGRKGEAEAAYGVIEGLVRDMPGLAEEKQALAQMGKATAAATSTAGQSSLGEPEPPPVDAVAAAGRQASVFSPAQLKPLFYRLRPLLPYWHWAALALLVLILAALFVRPGGKPSRESLQSAVTEQGSPQAIMIRPMVASEQAITAQPRQITPPSDTPAADSAEPPAIEGNRMRVGTLQIEESTPRP